MIIEEWYKLNNANHAHCEHGCDHPQPFVIEDKAYCGRCWFVEKKHVLVQACNSNDVCLLG